MKHIKTFEGRDENVVLRKFALAKYKEEYKKYFGKFVIIKFKKTGRLDMVKILELDQELYFEEFPYLVCDRTNNYNHLDKTAITITNIDILEVYDTVEEAKYNFNIMTTANKYNI